MQGRDSATSKFVQNCRKLVKNKKWLFRDFARNRQKVVKKWEKSAKIPEFHFSKIRLKRQYVGENEPKNTFIRRAHPTPFLMKIDDFRQIRRRCTRIQNLAILTFWRKYILDKMIYISYNFISYKFINVIDV